MFYSDNIEGISILQNEIPNELQDWHEFGNILEMHYYKQIFDESSFNYVSCIELLLTDIQNRYTIKVLLFNVVGELSFDMINGFYSGFLIEDCSDWGYEKECRYRISSYEDISFEIFCEKVKVELVR